MSKSKRRARLFSLSARVARASRRRDDARAHGDDGCPICVAIRSGLDPWAVFPGADGSPPRLDPRILVDAARKALVEEKPAAGVTVPFIQYGTAQPDGSFADSAFSVDGRGRIYWTSPTQHTLITQIALA